MEQTIEFDVKMKVKDMYQFLLYHTYSRFSGWFGVILSLWAIVMLVMNYETYDDQRKLILFVIGLLFTIVNPIMLLSKAHQQVVLNPVYKKPLHYKISDAGITIAQEDQEQTMEWNQMYQYHEFCGSIFVYTSKIHAFIFPAKQMGEQKGAIKQCLMEHFQKTDKA